MMALYIICNAMYEMMLYAELKKYKLPEMSIGESVAMLMKYEEYGPIRNRSINHLYYIK